VCCSVHLSCLAEVFFSATSSIATSMISVRPSVCLSVCNVDGSCTSHRATQTASRHLHAEADPDRGILSLRILLRTTSGHVGSLECMGKRGVLHFGGIQRLSSRAISASPAELLYPSETASFFQRQATSSVGITDSSAGVKNFQPDVRIGLGLNVGLYGTQVAR